MSPHYYLLASLFLLFNVIAVIYRARRPRSRYPPGKSFVLSNVIAHRRLLPIQSKHFFSYRTVAVLVSLRELEEGQLDVAGGWLFGYNSTFNVTGIHPRTYLTDILAKPGKGPKPVSIREKLDALLGERGWDTTRVTDVWLGVMPSFFGYVGSNPATSYYLYKNTVGPTGEVVPKLWLVVLEIDNTFGEKHIYILETGVNEVPGWTPGAIYDHCWIIPRQVHISPFNDRSGFYKIYIRTIPAPSECDGSKAPHPMIKLDHLTEAEPHQMKMIATQSCIEADSMAPLSLLSHITKAPIALALTWHRIMYQAFLLHYQKRCDVYPRPEPPALLAEVEERLCPDRNPVQRPLYSVGNGTGWNAEGTLERWARQRTEWFIAQRVQEVGGSVKLVSSNPLIPSTTFVGPVSKTSPTDSELTIYIRSSRFFTIMLLSPTPLHALLLGSNSERVFAASSRDAFLSFFSSTWTPLPTSLFSTLILTAVHAIRTRLIPDHILTTYPVPATVQPMDAHPSLPLLVLVALLYTSDRLSEALYNGLGARFVSDRNPWRSWDRVDKEHEKVDLGTVYHPLPTPSGAQWRSFLHYFLIGGRTSYKNTVF